MVSRTAGATRAEHGSLLKWASRRVQQAWRGATLQASNVQRLNMPTLKLFRVQQALAWCSIAGVQRATSKHADVQAASLERVRVAQAASLAVRMLYKLQA
jgi:hypothetical protein